LLKKAGKDMRGTSRRVAWSGILCAAGAALSAAAFQNTPASSPASRPSGPPLSADQRLLRGPSEGRYRLTMLGFDKFRELRLRQIAEFTLKTGADGRESVELLSGVRLLPPSRDPEPVASSEDCRKAFGGDAQVLARFAFTPTSIRRPSALIPACASRDVFGIVTDILMCLSVQSREYGIDQLRAPGDRHAFGPFEAEWTQPPEVIHGRIVCPGGELLLERIEDGKAHVRWQPQPFDRGTVNQTPSGAINLIAGAETVSLTLVIELATGKLLEANCELDDIDLQGWLPFKGDKVPDRKDWPKTSGLPVKMSRQLKLELIPTTTGPTTRPG
jgi:hypothetical protein